MKRKLLLKGLVLFVCILLFSATTTSAQDFCQGLADYDQDVDGTDASMFKSHFGRSTFSNPCPDDGPAPVESSGQTISYATGDDGHLESGVDWPNPRFTDKGDGTIIDNLTGLIWLKNANCFGNRTWSNALSDCNGLEDGLCGLIDGSQAGEWRLPHTKELQSLVDYSRGGMIALPIGHPFENFIPGASFWSSTTWAPSYGTSAWYMFMGEGYCRFIGKDNSFYVWPVRGGH